MAETKKKATPEAQEKMEEKTQQPRWFNEQLPACTGTLDERIAAIKMELVDVPKTGRNDRFNYDYHTDSDIANPVRALTGKHGVAIYPTVESYEQVERKVGEKTSHLTTLEIHFLLSCIGDGGNPESNPTTRVMRWYGQAEDFGDKGFYQAYTGACKTFLQKLFEIGGDEGDPEAGQASDEQAAAREAGKPTSKGARTAGGGSPDELATQKQKDFIGRLLGERAMTDKEQIEFKEQLESDTFSRKQASEMIGKLKELSKNEEISVDPNQGELGVAAPTDADAPAVEPGEGEPEDGDDNDDLPFG